MSEDKQEWLRRITEEDAPDDPDTLRATLHRLHQWQAPMPSDTPGLIDELASALPQPRRRFRLDSWWPLLLVRSQLRLARVEIWLVSALVLALGTAVTPATVSADMLYQRLPLVLLAPVVAALGVILVYGGEPALEIERATPVSPRLLLAARLALVFGFNLVLGVIASFVLTLVEPGLALWPLVSAWLAPMALLTALAFLIGVLFVDPAISLTFSAALWLIQVLRQAPDLSIFPLLAYVPDMYAAQAQPVVLVAALALATVAVWLGNRDAAQYGGVEPRGW